MKPSKRHLKSVGRRSDFDNSIGIRNSNEKHPGSYTKPALQSIERVKSKKEYTVDEIRQSLRLKGVSVGDGVLIKTIDVGKAHTLGNKSWGKIDFLVNYQNFSIINMNEYKKQFN